MRLSAAVGPVMFAVNGCWKRNSFSTSLVAATVAAVAAAPVAVASMDIHDCLYVCIGDDGGGGRYALVLWIRLTGSVFVSKMSKHDVSPREDLVTTDAKHDDQFSKVKFLSLVNFLLRKSIRERASYKLFSWYIYKRAITKKN
jgi:hypothetical protein